jgi:hypothetical protein
VHISRYATFVNTFAVALHAKGMVLSVDYFSNLAIWDLPALNGTAVDTLISMDTYVLCSPTTVIKQRICSTLFYKLFLCVPSYSKTYLFIPLAELVCVASPLFVNTKMLFVNIALCCAFSLHWCECSVFGSCERHA